MWINLAHLMLSRAFAILMAAACRASAQEALPDALPAPPPMLAQPAPSHQARGSTCAKQRRVIRKHKKRPTGSKRSHFYPANSPKAVPHRKAFFAFE